MSSNPFDFYYDDFGIILSYTPFIVSFVSAFALLANKRKTKPQIFLAIAFVVIGSGSLFSMWYEHYGAENRNEILRSGSMIFTTLVTISALLYFIVLIQPSRLTTRYKVSLLAVTLGFILFVFIGDYLFGKTENATNYKELFKNTASLEVLFRVTANVMLIALEIYAMLTVLKMYKRHRKFIQESFSYQEDIDLRWILYSIVLFALLAITDMSWIINSNLINKIISTIMMLVIICNIFWLGFRQDPVPLMEEYEKKQEEDKKYDQPTSQNILFTEREKFKSDLLTYFEEQKPYLNSNLSLTEVASSLNTNRTYLSQIINEDLEMNFYSLVNQYRIDHAIALMEEQDYNLTIDGLCKSAGFKSRSVFYSQFKEKTGLLPGEYIKKRIIPD